MQTLPMWQAYTGYDAHSVTAPITITNSNQVELVYDSSSVPIDYGVRQAIIDGKDYFGDIIVQPFHSAIIYSFSN
jgi:hypothetical protein